MKKTVCFYGVSTDLGGAERSLIEIVKGLKEDTESEWSPWVLLPKKAGPLIDELKKMDIQISIVEMPIQFLKVSRKNIWSILNLFFSVPGFFIYFFSVAREMKKNKPVLIHTTGVKCHLLAPWFGIIQRIPVLWHIRDIFPEGFTIIMLRLMIKIFRINVIANSKATSVPFKKSKIKIEVIYNGINPNEFYPMRNSRYRKLFPITNEVLIVGIVGAFARWKGQFEFLEAAKILMDRKVPVCFVVVGGEIYDTNGETNLTNLLKEEAKRFGIEEKVVFTGFEKNSPIVMNGIDILVHASTQPEPFGRVIIEGMACECSLVASRWGAAPEFFVNNINGLVVNPKNPIEIADAVEWLVQHPEERRVMIQNSRKLFLDGFAHKNYIHAMEREFDKVLKG